ncbi:hypothetical protein AMJ85_11555 [candidate division BRC1 bacterium SM23_51]|nr:MAG: hypothetical protein AMJ85_11555 [candidate division BRC1 bacterium SM23_51]
MNFRPQMVTNHFNKARFAWAYYLPQIYIRTWWAVPHEPLEKVAKRYRNIVFCDLFDPTIAAQIAEGLYEIRQWSDASEFARRAIAGDPYNMDLRTKGLYVERGKTGRQIAKDAIEQLAHDFRHRPEIETTVAELYYAAGLAAEAEKASRAILEKDPANKTAFNNVLSLLRLQGKTEESEQIVAPFVAEHASLVGDWALVDTVNYYIDRREYERAALFLSKNLNYLDRSPGAAMIMLGRLKWFRGDLDGAREEFERYYERYGGSEGAMDLPQLEALRGNWDVMRNQSYRILADRHTMMTGYFLNAIYSLHQGDIPQGEKAIGTGLAYKVHDPEDYQTFALWQFYRGDFPAVIKACNNGQRYVRGPYDRWLDVTELRARLAMGDVEGAEPIVKRMRLLLPFFVWTYIGEALWQLGKGDIAAARNAIEVARRYNPRDTHTQVAHGRILLAEGKTEEAIVELRYAADHVHAPRHLTEACYYLGQALEKARKTDEAAKAYERLLDLWAAGGWADKAKEGLERCR